MLSHIRAGVPCVRFKVAKVLPPLPLVRHCLPRVKSSRAMSCQLVAVGHAAMV